MNPFRAWQAICGDAGYITASVPVFFKIFLDHGERDIHALTICTAKQGQLHFYAIGIKILRHFLSAIYMATWQLVPCFI